MASIFKYLTKRAFERDINTPSNDTSLFETREKQAALSRTRKIPMRVLPLGMCRTGELSLSEALKILGYRPFGMAEATKSPQVVIPLWNEAVDAKYNPFPESNNSSQPKTKWTKKEFDAMLSSYDSVIGVPCCFFAEELISAYPEAKVILTTRSTQSWVQSMQIAGMEMITWSGVDFLIKWDTTFSGPLYNLIKSQMKVMCNTDDSRPDGHTAKYFEKHNNTVRALVPKDQLLEYNPEQGWGPLCKFLGCEVPNQPFPLIQEDTDDQMIRKFQRSLWYIGMARSLFKAGIVYFGIPGLVLGGWFYQDAALNLVRSTLRSLQTLV